MRVNALVTGLIDTPLWRSAVQAHPEIEDRFLGQIPTGRPGAEEDVAVAALLLSEQRLRERCHARRRRRLHRAMRTGDGRRLVSRERPEPRPRRPSAPPGRG
ncbi:hypothetical protein ACH5AL_31480 [Actinacidiphila glaucinigra]|uniref:hypothetical protein n=1 Tax=Actinacidiphila glaucinigra TaxID=235986 RepID=UPI003788F1AB